MNKELTEKWERYAGGAYSLVQKVKITAEEARQRRETHYYCQLCYSKHRLGEACRYYWVLWILLDRYYAMRRGQETFDCPVCSGFHFFDKEDVSLFDCPEQTMASSLPPILDTPSPAPRPMLPNIAPPMPAGPLPTDPVTPAFPPPLCGAIKTRM